MITEHCIYASLSSSSAGVALNTINSLFFWWREGGDTPAAFSFWNLHSTAFQQGGLSRLPPKPLERAVHRAVMQDLVRHWSDVMRQLLRFVSRRANDLCTQLEKALPEGSPVPPRAASVGRGKQAWHVLIRVPRVRGKDSLTPLRVTRCPQRAGMMPSVTAADTCLPCGGSRLALRARVSGWSLDAAYLRLTPSADLLGMPAGFLNRLCKPQWCSTAPTPQQQEVSDGLVWHWVYCINIYQYWFVVKAPVSAL